MSFFYSRGEAFVKEFIVGVVGAMIAFYFSFADERVPFRAFPAVLAMTYFGCIHGLLHGEAPNLEVKNL